jgi:uncharacterized membrane protein
MITNNALRLRASSANDIGDADGGARIAARAVFGVVFILLCDLLWLGLIANWLGVYKPYIDQEHNSSFRLVVGLIAYAAVAGGVSCVFVADSVALAAGAGALMGFWVFAGYNITTWATTSGRYTLKIAICDTVYGVLVTAILFAAQSSISTNV